MSDIIDATAIANRALQRCGAALIANDTTLWLEDSTNARQIRACYDILRRSELRRNMWRCSIRRAPLRAIDTTSFMYVPSTYSAATSYPLNAIVIYNGTWYLSIIAANFANTPADDSAAWTRYFASPMVTPWDSGTTYMLGELVYTPSTTAGQVFMSLSNQNEDTPTGTPAAWVSTSTYAVGAVVTGSDTHIYVSLVPLNINLNPITAANAIYWVRLDSGSPSAWSSGTTYAAAALATGTDGLVYQSRAAGNLAHDPVTTTGYWNLTPKTQAQKPVGNWMLLDGTLLAINIIYPAGSGPRSQQGTRNVYLLPQGYLRQAPQDPKAGIASIMGFPANRMVDDWVFENNLLVTSDNGVIVFRFAADITNAAEFDPMFVEGLGCRIALEVCEPLTQSATKMQAIASEYKLIMGEAREVNGIEQGATMPPLDDFIATRY